MNYFKLLIYFLMLQTITNCLPKRDKSNYEPQTKLVIPTKRAANTIHHVYALGNERESINAEELFIFRATLARTELGNILIPKLNFGVDKRADYVEWQACPYTLPIPCLQGATMNSEVYMGLIEPDQYTVTLKACVNPIRSTISEKNCGPVYTISWVQDDPYSVKKEDQIGELLSKEHEIYALGENLHEILQQFKGELNYCMKTQGKTNIKAERLMMVVAEEIDKQLENLLNLGPKFIAEHIGLVDPSEDDEELAAIVEPTLISDEEAYTPKGLSLLQENASQKIDAYFQSLDVRLVNSYNIFPDISVSELVKANSGIFSSSGHELVNSEPTKKFTSEQFAQLSLRERSAAMGGAILQSGGLSLTTNPEKESYGAAQMIRAMLWLEKPEYYECQAFDRVEKTLSKTRIQLQLLRERIVELKAILLNSKSK